MKPKITNAANKPSESALVQPNELPLLRKICSPIIEIINVITPATSNLCLYEITQKIKAEIFCSIKVFLNVSCQLSVVSCQYSVVSCPLLVVSCQYSVKLRVESWKLRAESWWLRVDGWELRVEVENCGINERCDAFQIFKSSNFQIIKLSNSQILKSSNFHIITSPHRLFKRWKTLLLAPVAAASF